MTLPPGAVLRPGMTPSPVGGAAPASAGRSEASTKTVQNVLFVLGGLLLAAAAIVFTAVAWASFGVLGRATILAVVTLLTLAVPPLVMRRGLRATAETFASLGLLLVVLDGYAAWYVNLAGLARGTLPTTYAGITFAATAVIAGGYAALTRLRAPRLAAVVAIQPVLPLLALHRGFGATGWTLVFVCVAAVALLLARTVEPVAWAAAGAAVLAALPPALHALATVEHVPAALRIAGVLVLLAALVVTAGAMHPRTANLGAGIATGIVTLGAARLVAEVFPAQRYVAFAVLILLLAGAALVTPRRFRAGTRIGALVMSLAFAVPYAAFAGLAAARTAVHALPAWNADPATSGTPLFGWQEPAALVVLAAAVWLLTRPSTGTRGLATTAPASGGAETPAQAPSTRTRGLATTAPAGGGAETPAQAPSTRTRGLATTAPASGGAETPAQAPSTRTRGLATSAPAGGGAERTGAGLPVVTVMTRVILVAALVLLAYATPGAIASGADPALACLFDAAALAILAAWPSRVALAAMPFVAAHLAVAGLVTPPVTLGAYAVLGLVAASVAIRVSARGPGLVAGTVALLSLPVLGAAAARELSAGTALGGTALGGTALGGTALGGTALAGAAVGLALVTAAAVALRNRAWNAGTLATAVAGAGVAIAAVAETSVNGGATWFGTYAAAALLCTWFAARAFTPAANGNPLAHTATPVPADNARGEQRRNATSVPAGNAHGEQGRNATSVPANDARGDQGRNATSVPANDARDEQRRNATSVPAGNARGEQGRNATPPPAGNARDEAGIAPDEHGTVRDEQGQNATPVARWRVSDGAAHAGHAVAAVIPAVLAVISLLPAVLDVLLRPLSWLGAIWSGAPSGVGLGPEGSAWWENEPSAFGPAAAAVTLAVLAGLAVLVAGRFKLGRWSLAAPPALLAAVLGCVAIGAPWPVVPAVTLATGLVTALGAALRKPSAGTVVGAVTCWFGIVPGMAGLLATSWSTLAALGAVVVAAAAAGVAGRSVVARAIAWPVGGVALAWFAFATGQAADLPLAATAYVVLGAAAVALGAGYLLQSREIEGPILDAVAHAVGVIAFLLAIGDLGAAAGIAALWGVALGLRAIGGPARLAYTVAAVLAEVVAYEFMLVAEHVGVVEAYTAPAGVAALVVGWFAARRNPSLGSWTAFGPGLLAGMLPSLALVIVTPGDPGRRLLLGIGAVAVVLAGALLRLKAPIVTGGLVLAVLAWHEVVVYWDLLPRWAPLAVAGAVLVGLAVTYERRLRDLHRLRNAMGRMR
ncbi:SCO7613 C-terminal domain-containing membrane protein [Dactylosporangium sp. CS-033363]|uniref:SCO7613 C-terminal domain-containing membrane protein n=1 Tax=Dactylosporangium sp. CS-033363 TaxID=3239935 RepID=UPI003D908599